MTKTMYVYILSSQSGALYIGVTNNLRRRMGEHRRSTEGAHSTRYRIGKLVYWEIHDAPRTAIRREKVLKRWRRERKIALIESRNPGWVDLAAVDLRLPAWSDGMADRQRERW